MVEINNTTKQKIDRARTVRLVEDFLRVYKKGAQNVSVALVGSKAMRSLNFRYRRIDKATDVLSFPSFSVWPKSDQNKSLGEVVINLDEVRKATKYRELFGAVKKTDYVFFFILVHGLLHLAGYKDSRESERQEMLDLGRRFLERYYL